MNKKWKLLIVMLCLTLLLSIAVAAHAEPVEHTSDHVMGPWEWSEGAARCPGELKPATRKCTFPGCKEEETAMRPGTGEHSFTQYIPTSPATCTAPGFEEAFCDYCNKQPDTRPQDGSKPLGHTYEDPNDPSAKGETTPATCTQAGKTVYTCTRKGCTASTTGHTKEEAISALGHTYEDPADPSAEGETTPATCTEDGKTVWTCTRCEAGTDGHTKEVTIEKLGHSFTDSLGDGQAATCTTDGYGDTMKCVRCTETQKGEVIKAKGHNWDKGTVTKAATTKATGVKTYTCKGWGEDNACDGYFGENGEADEWGATGENENSHAIKTESIPKKKVSSSSSSSSQPVATDEPIAPYGSIVTDVARAEEDYETAIVEEPIEGSEEVNHVLTVTAEPDEDGAYVLRNLHITDELLSQMAADHIEIVRFVVGTATVEFPVSSFTGETVEVIKADLESPAVAFIVTVDPTATTEDGVPGVSVSASVACEDGSEYDITGLVANLTLTVNETTQSVTQAAVYTA